MPSPASQRPAARVGLVQVSVAGVLWGTGGLGAQVVRRYAEFSPLTISAYRTAIAALVLVIVVLAMRQLGRVHSLFRASPGRVVVIGLATAAYQGLYFFGCRVGGRDRSDGYRVRAGSGPADLARRRTSAQLAPSRQPRSGYCRPDRISAGQRLIASRHDRSTAGARCHRRDRLGVAYAAATDLGGPLARQHAPLALTTASMCIGALALIPAALLGVHWFGGPLTTGDPRALITLAYLGAATTALALLAPLLRASDDAEQCCRCRHAARARDGRGLRGTAAR